ncbi:MAG: hypothetical protein HY979_02340 [Candidatus Magasanikbacteria bacterium]|nr:hypothetical protein [Candidatus Magasanikbacteria bacterium]
MNKSSATGTGRNTPAMSHESTGVPPTQVLPIQWWTCEASVIRDEELGLPEHCGGQNASWDQKCKECAAPRPK